MTMETDTPQAASPVAKMPGKTAKKTSASKASAVGRNRPRVKIELTHEKVERTWMLTRPTQRLLADYTEFLSDFHGQSVSEDGVVEGLLKDLRKDRLFEAWLAKRPKREST